MGTESIGETIHNAEELHMDLMCAQGFYPNAVLVGGTVYRVDSLPQATGLWFDEEQRAYPCVRIGQCVVIEKTYYMGKASWYVLHRLLEQKPELLADVLKAVRE